MPKGHRDQQAKASIGQNWDNFSNEINNIPLNYNPKYQIYIHEFIPI